MEVFTVDMILRCAGHSHDYLACRAANSLPCHLASTTQVRGWDRMRVSLLVVTVALLPVLDS